MVRWFPISVLMASGLHLVWALGLYIDPASRNATAIHALLLITSMPDRAAVILVIVASLAVVGCLLNSRFGPWRGLLMLPQLGILIMSSISALSAMVGRSFADGVLRPFWFITVDQVPIILMAAGYLLALSRVMTEGEEWKWPTTAS